MMANGKLSPSPQKIKLLLRSMEDWWFDKTRSIQTSGYESIKQSQVVGALGDSNMYGPVRVSNAHHALLDLPIADFRDYTFIDVGSGKGRVLFIAAEHPFRRVCGVEFAHHLHEESRANIQHYRHRRQRCTNIESIHANAAELDFPDENLVLYLFNPFGPEVMSRMLANLEQSIARCPRHVILLLLWPEQSDLVSRMQGMHLYKQIRRHHIYQTTNPPIQTH
jgi:SAM-dependent methyltransferase